MNTIVKGKADEIQNELENKKAGDWMESRMVQKKGDDETVKRLVTIFTRVKEEREIPNPWRETAIKSIYKGGKPICVS